MSDRFHNLAWPAAIVLLLLSSVGLMTAVLVAANSDGGAQVVDDYYNRAVAWDSLAALRSTSVERGWTIGPEVDADGTASLTVRDSTGTPVTGLAGEVSVRRPHLADAVHVAAISADPDLPGVYTFDVNAAGSGIWIFEVELHRGALLHVAELRTRADIR